MAILDTVISLAFVYLILSLICSGIQEIIASAFKLRANNLQEGIRVLLEKANITDDKGKPVDLTAKVFDHPLVKNLAKAGHKPSYMPAKTFATALLDAIKDPAKPGGPLSQAKMSIATLPDGDLRKSLQAIVDGTGDKADDIRLGIENWFDDTMDRASGWYKRKTRNVMLVIAGLITIALNVDTVVLTKTLWREPAMRAAVVASAQGFVASRDTAAVAGDTAAVAGDTAAVAGDTTIVASDSSAITTAQGKSIDQLRSEFESLPLPVGWGNFKPKSSAFEHLVYAILWSLPGWILTALAVSLGAPFWFDGLGKLFNLRAAGKQPARVS